MAKAGGAFLVPARNHPGAFLRRTSLLLHSTRARRGFDGGKSFWKHLLQAPLLRCICTWIPFLVLAHHCLFPSIPPGGGRQHPQEVAAQLANPGQKSSRHGSVARPNWLGCIYCCHWLGKWTREEIPGPRLLCEPGSSC